jgi:glycosyltransferase involved in cell wall biosynthesis
MTRDRPTILYVDEAVSFGGSIVVLGSLVEAIDKQKFRSVVVGEMSRSILSYHIRDSARIYVIPRMFNYAHWIKATRIINRVRFMFLRKLIIYLLSGVRSLVNTVYIARLVNVILKEKVDIVHVNNGMSNLGPIIAAILLGRKCIVHFHGLGKPGFIQRLLLFKVHKYIAISQYLSEALVENGFPTDRMVVIPNPVQETHALSMNGLDMHRQYGLGSEDKVFGIVGRIVRWKGHIEFLKAAFLALDMVPDSKALIVGDFSDGNLGYQEQIINIVEESGFKDRVIMTGYLENLGSIYSIMDVCVHASIKPEPFGLVIIEAMANGVPVIASDLGAPKEIITDGANGYLINPESTEKLAEMIVSLLTDEELKKKIGNKGREHVQDNYQVNKYARSVEKIYSELLEKSA